MPSKVMVSVMVSPTLLPGVPATAVPTAVAGATVVLRVGGVVSAMATVTARSVAKVAPVPALVATTVKL